MHTNTKLIPSPASPKKNSRTNPTLDFPPQIPKSSVGIGNRGDHQNASPKFRNISARLSSISSADSGLISYFAHKPNPDLNGGAEDCRSSIGASSRAKISRTYPAGETPCAWAWTFNGASSSSGISITIATSLLHTIVSRMLTPQYCARGASPGRGFFLDFVAFAGGEEEVRLEAVLAGVEVVVAAAEAVERLMGSALQNQAGLDDQDLVGAADGR